MREVLSSNYSIELPRCKQHLGPVRACGQLLTSYLFSDARPRETNKRVRFSQDHISQACETGKHPPGRRIRQDRKIEQARSVKALNCRRRFRHLHQADDALLQTRATSIAGSYTHLTL